MTTMTRRSLFAALLAPAVAAVAVARPTRTFTTPWLPTGTGNYGTGYGGVMYLLNTKYIEWYFSTNPKFQYGFTGFKESNNSMDVAGQFLVGHDLVVPNPRSGAKILNTTF